MRALLPIAIALFAACGDDGGTATPADAAGKMDAPAAQATVMTVDCTGITPAATVTTDDNTLSYAPAMSTISVGGVVKFQTSLMHDVKPNPVAPHSDPGLTVDFNKTACLKFTQAGTFGFLCSLHGFTGTITVQ